MRRLAATALALLAAIALAGCTPTDDPETAGPPPDKAAGSFFGWIEDINGGEIVHDIAITVDGFALYSDGQGNSNWGADWATTGLPGPLPLDMVKRSPHRQPVYWDPGQTISLSVTVIFEDASFGDKVQCWQEDAAGVMKRESQRTTIKETPGRPGTISVNCNFLFS